MAKAPGRKLSETMKELAGVVQRDPQTCAAGSPRCSSQRLSTSRSGPERRSTWMNY
jgi:hypothetical protein